MAGAKKVRPPLSADQQREVDELCELWRWLLDFRAGKREALARADDRLAAALATKPGSEVERVRNQAKIDYLRHRSESLRRLGEELDAGLYPSTRRKMPPRELRRRFEDASIGAISRVVRDRALAFAAEEIQRWITSPSKDDAHLAVLGIVGARSAMDLEGANAFAEDELAAVLEELIASVEPAREIMEAARESKRVGPWALANECLASLCGISSSLVEKARKRTPH